MPQDNQAFKGNPRNDNQASQGSGGFSGPGTDIFSMDENPFAPPQQRQQQQQQEQNEFDTKRPPAAEPFNRSSRNPESNSGDGGNGAGANPLDRWAPKRDNGNAENANQQQQQQQAAPTKQEQQQQQQSVFDNDYNKYRSVVDKHDFVGDVTPETMQQIMNGDTKALSDLLNNVARSAVASASFMSSTVAKKGYEEQLGRFRESELPGLLKNHSFEQGWANTKDDVLKHPAVQGIVRTKQDEFMQQYPDAPFSDIQEMVREYLKDVAGAFAGREQEEQQRSTGAQDETDLQKFFNQG